MPLKLMNLTDPVSTEGRMAEHSVARRPSHCGSFSDAFEREAHVRASINATIAPAIHRYTVVMERKSRSISGDAMHLMASSKRLFGPSITHAWHYLSVGLVPRPSHP